MRAHGSSAAKLLLLLLCTTRTTTINGRLLRAKRATNTSTIQAIIVNDDINEQAQRISNELLSTAESQNVVSRQNDVEPVLDQQVEQSEVVMVRDESVDALSVMEYEPQKIQRKGKRRVANNYNNPEIQISSSETKDPAPTIVGAVYYELPVPQKRANIESKSKNEYLYPVAASNRINKARYPKNRVVPTPQTTTTQEVKLDNVAPTTITLLPRAYLPIPNDLKKPKHYVDLAITSTPSNNDYQSTKSIRKKKNRKRNRDKQSNKENDYNLEENYPKPRNQASIDNGKSKSKRSRLVAKYDVPPRPFTPTNPPKQGNLEKLDVEGVASSPARGSINRNQPNAAGIKEESSNEHLSKVIDPVRSPSTGSSRKQYERKHAKDNNDSSESSEDREEIDQQRNASERPYRGRINYEPTLEDKLVEPEQTGKIVAVTPSSLTAPAGMEVYVYPATASSLDVYQNVKSLNPQNDDSNNSENVKQPSGKITTVTPSAFNIEVYQSIKEAVSPTISDYGSGKHASNSKVYEYGKGPTVAPSKVYETSGKVQTVTPSNSKAFENGNKVSTVTPTSYIYHTLKPPAITIHTVGTTGSTAYPTINYYPAPTVASNLRTWTPEAKFNQLKENKREEEEDSDGLAEATSLESGEEDDSREVQGNYKGYDGSGEQQSASEVAGSRAYRHNDQQVYGNGQNEYQKRYAQKYDESNDDVLAEGTQHAEGTTGGGKGDDGGEFEEGGTAKREEGHLTVEGEKGEKGYESWHKDIKNTKGHHNKEQHKNHYKEEDGKDKHHNEEGGYHELHEKGEKGEKGAEFDEKGRHQKGYNTKGQHSVHKKDEFEKRTEFFDEFNEGDEFENEGEFHKDHEGSKGGHYKKGHLDHVDHEDKYGKESKHSQGKQYREEDGHEGEEGHEAHYEHENKHGEKKSDEGKRNWGYKEGSGGDGKKGDDHH